LCCRKRASSHNSAPPSRRTAPGTLGDAPFDLGLTQAPLAARVGAARKAVVYQWESRKRCPSPLFWERICDLGAANSDQ